jgi:hypothetical protein
MHEWSVLTECANFEAAQMCGLCNVSACFNTVRHGHCPRIRR